jgi:phiEco32-like amidoligase-type 2 protein
MKSTTTPFVLTVGSDPELLLRNRKTGEIVSAIDVLKQGKDNKIDLGNGIPVYYDNVLVETNVPYAASAKELVKNVKGTFLRIAKYIGKEYELLAQASHTFATEQCQHEDARVFGCNPEYCAYNVETVAPPTNEDGNTFRSAGGHIHVGRSDFNSVKNQNNEFLLDPFSKLEMVKVMDLVVGLSIALVDNDPTSPARKKLYGNAGRHRPTPYGVEYRTPGNYWLSNPELTELVYDLTEYAAGLVREGKHKELLASFNSDEVIEAINTNNKGNAAKLLAKVNLPASLMKRVQVQAKKPVVPLYEAWGIK